jgi:hypothetical protein
LCCRSERRTDVREEQRFRLRTFKNRMLERLTDCEREREETAEALKELHHLTVDKMSVPRIVTCGNKIILDICECCSYEI